MSFISELEEQISSGCVAAVALLLANQVTTARSQTKWFFGWFWVGCFSFLFVVCFTLSLSNLLRSTWPTWATVPLSSSTLPEKKAFLWLPSRWLLSDLLVLRTKQSEPPKKVDHTLHNEDERLRLRHLGHNGDQLGGHNFTRCFGNYLVKVCSTVLFIQIRHDAYGEGTDENVFQGWPQGGPSFGGL